jgi:outer membrane biosynthesis protein TonB
MRSLFAVLLVLALLVSCAQTVGKPASSQPVRLPLQTMSNETKEYFVDLQRVVQSSWHCPKELAARKDLYVLVMLTIGRDGSILARTFDRWSGNKGFDDAVLSSVHSIDRLPPIPESFKTETIGISFKFLVGATGDEHSKD